MKTFRQIGMTTMKPWPHKTNMTWTDISEMIIKMRASKKLFNHMSQKKMLDKKFVDTKRVSHQPAFPGSRRCRRRGKRSSRRTSSRRRTGPMPQDLPQDPCRRTTACPREPPLTRRVRAGLGERKTL